MDPNEFRYNRAALRTDVTLLREGLQTLKGLIVQLDAENYKDVQELMTEVVNKTLWECEMEAEQCV